jgi:hypothetical protein
MTGGSDIPDCDSIGRIRVPAALDLVADQHPPFRADGSLTSLVQDSPPQIDDAAAESRRLFDGDDEPL